MLRFNTYIWVTLFAFGLLLLAFSFLESCTDSKANAPFQSASTSGVPTKIDFNFHVRPILSDRCYTCHGPDKNKLEAGLRLDIKESAFGELEEYPGHFAIVAGKPNESELIARIFEEDPDEVMPPPESHLSLNEVEKEILKRWIEQGAEWKSHWAFIPPIKPEVPKISKTETAHNEIDHFILAKVALAGLSPSPEATKEKLIRRVTLDLTGLPPTVEEIDAFLADTDPRAYENLVDRLLATLAYAERMANEWLDVARYADSHGYQDDLERIMWPWRDWVIKAFNENLPYDEFLKWQLAGDLLPNATPEQILATGFNRNHMITQEGGVIPEEYRVEYVVDRTGTVGTAFLGLTMECARCHDHKYDPITQKNFYELFAFFNNVDEKGLIGYNEIPEPLLVMTPEEVQETLSFIKDTVMEEKFSFMVMEEMDTARQAYVLLRGAYDNHGEPVSPVPPDFIMDYPDSLPPNRLGLAKWLALPGNPLTSRVAVNRYWQVMFGTGLVSTSDDFGSQGSLPTHPALLDWLAVDFQESGWDIKGLMKKIAMSATYRQASDLREDLLEKDKENTWLARGPRYRLPAEMIRDQALAISGLLSTKVGGPSVKPYQPAGIWEEKIGGGGGSLAKYVTGEGDDLYRRSMYTFWKRTVPPPSMMTFDTPERTKCTVKRQATSTPLQALVLLNDPQYVEASRATAYKIMEGEASTENKIALGFKSITGRSPSEKELDLLVNYFEYQLSTFQADPEGAEALLMVGDFAHDECLDAAEAAAFTLVVSSIFNLDAAVTKS